MSDFAYTREWYEREYHEAIYALHTSTPDEIAEQWAKPHYREHLTAVWALLPRPLAGRALEVGVHHGKTACWMLDEFPAITALWGVDWSQVAIDFCERLGRKRLIPYCGLAEALPFTDNYFDAVSCVDFTEHLPPPVYHAVVEELTRVAAPGAPMILHHGRTAHPAHINPISEATLLADFFVAGWRHIAGTAEGYHALERKGTA